MNYDDFYDWLILKKQMSNRSAKDVISRCKRVCKLTVSSEIEKGTEQTLEKISEYNECSMFIKSQLKRAISLYNEFKKG